MTNDAWQPDPSRGEYLPPADPNVTCSPELRTRVLHDFAEYHRRRTGYRRAKMILVVAALLAVAYVVWVYFGR